MRYRFCSIQCRKLFQNRSCASKFLNPEC